jgi:hypothetical protein
LEQEIQNLLKVLEWMRFLQQKISSSCILPLLCAQAGDSNKSKLYYVS